MSVDADGDSSMIAADSSSSINKFGRPSVSAPSHTGLFDFKSEIKNFDKQYAAIYFTRLAHLKKVVLEAARVGLSASAAAASSSSSVKICTRILDIESDRMCVIAGTIYKEMKLKPFILQQQQHRSSDSASGASAAGSVYMSSDDSLILEDEFGRVGLTGSALTIPSLVSGVCVAVLGKEAEGGKFEVQQIFFAQVAKQQPVPQSITSGNLPPAYLLCVSGLSFGAPGQDATPIQLMMDYVTGLLGNKNDQADSARIVHVLFAGNNLHRFEKKRSKDYVGREENDTNELNQPLRELDQLLTQLAAAVQVDIMPGENDPSNFTLPQQPFHRCLFPSASTFSSFTPTTNPSWLQINGLQVLATAGQNVNDMAKYSEAASNIDYLENNLRWRNVAPTAPDTLGCYPYQHSDPFVLEESPHLYIVGNQPSYSTRVVSGPNGEKIRCVTLPSFAQSGTAVLININSPQFDTKPITFKIGKQEQHK